VFAVILPIAYIYEQSIGVVETVTTVLIIRIIKQKYHPNLDRVTHPVRSDDSVIMRNTEFYGTPV